MYGSYSRKIPADRQAGTARTCKAIAEYIGERPGRTILASELLARWSQAEIDVAVELRYVHPLIVGGLRYFAS